MANLKNEAAIWPVDFERFPCTIYAKEDADEEKKLINEAIVWFARKKHLDFSRWEEAGTRGSRDLNSLWKGLELMMENITQLSEEEICEAKYAAVAKVYEDGKPGSHASKADKIEIGRLACEHMLAEMGHVVYKEFSEKWLLGACTALAPRLVKLWKSRSSKRPPGDSDNEHSEDESSPSKRLKLMSGMPDPKPEVSSASKEKEFPQKISTKTSNSPSVKNSPASINTIHRTQCLPLYDRDLEVWYLEEEKPQLIVIPIQVLIDGDCNLRELAEDLRPEHLSIAKFMSLLTKENLPFSLSGSSLYWKSAEGVQYIIDQDDFQEAVGEMFLKAKNSGSDANLEVGLEWGMEGMSD